MAFFWRWLIVLLVVLGAGLIAWYGTSGRPAGHPVSLGLLSTTEGHDAQQSREAFESVLTEEGIPYTWLSGQALVRLSPAKAAKEIQALVLPDSLAQQVSPGVVSWISSYAARGGTVVVVFDAATKNHQDHYYAQSPLRAVTGVDNSPYDRLGDAMFTVSPVKFAKLPFAQEWGVTPGKLSADGNLLGYGYGKLSYPVIDAAKLQAGVEVWASGGEGQIPVLSRFSVGQGEGWWINLPLGRLKASGDDMLLRMALRRVAQAVDLPRLLPVPQGKGAILINWHVDANPDWVALPDLMKRGIISKDVRNSFHITAGPDRNVVGDRLGFDACGWGKPYALSLKPYGALGDHGGWGHEIFTGLMLTKGLVAESKRLVDVNTACVSSVEGAPVREYSAPNGVHPQPEMTLFLEKRGFVTYYYTGDSGGPPNRTFFEGEMVSPNMIAAPITPYHNLASVGEFAKNEVPPAEVQTWLTDLVEFARRERTIRLIYTHPYDLYQNPAYIPAWHGMTQSLVRHAQTGEMSTLSMEDAARFTLRFVQTQAQFAWAGRQLEIQLSNPGGLKDVAFRLPESCQSQPNPQGVAGQGTVRWVTAEQKEMKMQFVCS